MKRTAHTLTRIATALLLATLLPGMTGAYKTPYVEGDRLEFALTDLDGRPVAWTDPRFRNKVILVDIWGSWCPPCLTALPTFVRMQEKYGDRGFLVVGIAFEQEEDASERRQKLKLMGRTHGLNYLLLDGGHPERVMETLPTVKDFDGFPVEIFIGRDGRVKNIRNTYGYNEKWAMQVEMRIIALVNEAAPGSRKGAGSR